MFFSTLFFWIFACVAFMFSVGVIVARNPMHSALSLVATFVCLAGIFLQLHAEFLAFIIIIVYTGAVMVLIIFVISLLNLQREEPIDFTIPRRWGVGFMLIFVGTFFVYLFRDPLVNYTLPEKMQVPAYWGGAEEVGKYLFVHYILPFELASILLTAAVIGAVVLARRPRENQNGEGQG